ncbi:MAG: DinB family protein [Acidimicrobiia bacterium]|nr:DinB family protein [Acidimicrobiia bacterium]
MLDYHPAPRNGPEKDVLLGVLDENRFLMLWKLEGLTDEQAGRSTVESATTLLGLVKHLAYVEMWWFHEVVGGLSPEYPWSEDDPDADWRIEPGDSIESISRLYADAVATSDSILADVDLADTRVVRDEDRSIRWVVAHMIEETARHAGHADIVRELIDGITGYVPE